MEIKLDFDKKTNKLLKACMQDEQIDYFCYDKKAKCVKLMIADWNIDLYENGKWEIM